MSRPCLIRKRIGRMVEIALVLTVVFLLASAIVPALKPETEDGPGNASTLAVQNVTFVTTATSSAPAYVGDEVTFIATATSDVDTSLTFTIYYDYYTVPYPTVNPTSYVSVNTTVVPGTVVTKYTYDHIGNFSTDSGTYFYAKLTVTDGFTFYNKTIAVFVIANRAPYITFNLEPTVKVYKDVPKNLSIKVRDLDNDPVLVTWEFGDGSPNGTNLTDPALVERTVNQTHTWSPVLPNGTSKTSIDLQMNISLDDGQGNVPVYTYIVNVTLPANKAPVIRLFSYVGADPGTPAPFYANASDAEGEALTWTFDFGDGEVLSTWTDGAGPGVLVWMNVTHTYTVVGTYNVTLYVSDAEILEEQVFPHNVTVEVFIKISVNSPPVVLAYIPVSEENPLINETTDMAVVRFSLSVQDPDGDPLTLLWDFDDGSGTVTNVTAGGTAIFRFYVYHNFTFPGQFNVTVVVTDGRVGHEVYRWRLINVTSNNSGPDFRGLTVLYPYGRGSYALPDEPINFTVRVYDRERDPLFLSVRFGDGSPWYNVTITEFDVEGNATHSFQHSYSELGTYVVNVIITDNQLGRGEHTVYFNYTATIALEPPVTVSEWSWWDYTTLVLFAMIPVLMFLWYFVSKRRHEMLEDAGLTYDQYMVRKKEITKELRKRQRKGGGA